MSKKNILTEISQAIEDVSYLWNETPKLIVIDSMSALNLLNFKETTIDQIYSFFGDLKRKGIATLIIAHLRKSQKNQEEDDIESVYGSIGITAAADVVIVSQKKDSKLMLKIYGRNVRSRIIHVENPYAKWKILSGGGVKEKILNLLNTEGPLTISEIVEKTGFLYPTVANTLKRMVSKEEVIRLRQGLYKLPPL